MHNIFGRAANKFGRCDNIFRRFFVRWAIIAAGGRCGPGLRVKSGLRVRQGFHSGIRVGAGVYIGRQTTLDCPAEGLLTIGDHVTLTQGIFISAVRSVEIGDGTMIGEYTSIRDANHGMDLGPTMRSQPLVSASVSVGRDVWIGRGCAILAGVTINDGAVVASNAVVTRDVESTAIVGGIPAKLIRFRN